MIPRVGLSPVVFGLTLSGLIVRLVLTQNMYLISGIDYVRPGGSPLIKVHLGTYLILFAACLWVLGVGTKALGRHFHDHPSHLLFLSMMTLCMAHMVLNIGGDGALFVFVDTFICAGVVALLLTHASDDQRRVLAHVLLAVFVLNAIIAIGESVTHRTLVPRLDFPLDDAKVPIDDWRGMALNDSSLSGAMMTQMGVFLVLAMRTRWTALLLALLVFSLFSFGGRAALVVSIITLAMLLVGAIIRGLALRRLTRGIVTWFIGTSLAVPVLIGLALATSIGDRAITHMMLNDDSAMARDLAWNILGLLDSDKILFGSSLQTVQDYINWLHVGEIENPWLDLFLTLGAVGSLYFLIGFVPFIVHLWRTGGLFGQLLVVTELIVASTSNSIGRKSPVLVVMVATIYACAAYTTRATNNVQRYPTFRLIYARSPYGSAN